MNKCFKRKRIKKLNHNPNPNNHHHYYDRKQRVGGCLLTINTNKRNLIVFQLDRYSK